jgi:hypothetical protein
MNILPFVNFLCRVSPKKICKNIVISPDGSIELLRFEDDGITKKVYENEQQH